MSLPLRSPQGADEPFLPSDAAAPNRPRRRSFWAAAIVAVGYWTSDQLAGVDALWWLAAALAACALAAASRRLVCALSLALAGALLSAGYFAARVHDAPPDRLDRVLAASVPDAAPSLAPPAVLVTLEATFIERPRAIRRDAASLEAFAFGHDAWMAPMSVHAILTPAGRVPVSGKVWARLSREAPRAPDSSRPPAAAVHARAGSTVRITGWFSPFEPPLNPGATDYRRIAAQSGFVGRLRSTGADNVQPADDAHLPWSTRLSARWCSGLDSARSRAWSALFGEDSPAPGARTNAPVPAPSAITSPSSPPASLADARSRALVAALLLGEREDQYERLAEEFSRAGLVHLLSISGFHIAVMAWVALLALRVLADPGRFEPLIVCALVAGYVAIIPASTPVVRSALMVVLSLAGQAFSRRYDHLTLLAWIAVLLLVWRPLDLWSPGFQLSFLATGALFWQGKTAGPRLFFQDHPPIRGVRSDPPTLPRRAWRLLRDAIGVNVLCWSVAIPAVASHIGVITWLAVPASLLLVPVAALLLWLGYLALVVGFLFPITAGAFEPFLNACAALIARATAFCDSFQPAVTNLPRVSALWTAAATVAALAAFRWGSIRDPRTWAALFVLSLWTAGELRPRPPGPAVALRADALSVGDGSCILVRTPHGAFLWDCGSTSPSGRAHEIARACRELGAHRVHAAFVSHPDYDHFSMLPSVARRLDIRRVIVAPSVLDRARTDPDSPCAHLLRELDRSGVVVQSAARGLTLDPRARVIEPDTPAAHAPHSPTLRTLWPPPPAASTPDTPHAPTPRAAENPDPAPAGDNDSSLVVRVTVPTRAGPRSLLLCGDIERAAMHAISLEHPDLHADVVEAPHHGSAREFAERFVANLRPRAVLQSTGPLRAGHPLWNPLRRRAAWLCTATDGCSSALIHDDGSVTTAAFVPP